MIITDEIRERMAEMNIYSFLLAAEEQILLNYPYGDHVADGILGLRHVAGGSSLAGVGRSYNYLYYTGVFAAVYQGRYLAWHVDNCDHVYVFASRPQLPADWQTFGPNFDPQGGDLIHEEWDTFNEASYHAGGVAEGRSGDSFAGSRR